MKDLEQSYHCKASEIANKIQPLRDRGHIKGDNTLASVFDQTSFKNRIESRLTPEEVEYLKTMIISVGERFPTISKLRKAFNDKEEIFPPGDETNIHDMNLLKKVFGFESSVPIW